MVETMRANISFNGEEVEKKVHTINDDARLIMLKSHQVRGGGGPRGGGARGQGEGERRCCWG